MSDLKYLFRTLRRSPGYALTVVLTLALGIGANTAIFSLTYGILLEPLPYRDGEELVVLRQSAEGDEQVAVSIAEFFDYRRESRTMELVEYHGMSFTLLGRSEPERVSTGVVSHDFFNVLGVPPLHGRFFLPTDEEMGAEAVLVLSYPYFQRSFGADPAVVGQVFEMNDRPHTVVGVLPPIPQFPNEHDVYMPTSACPFRAAGQQQMHENRGAFRGLTVFGRLQPDAGAETAEAEIHTLAAGFVRDHGESYQRLPRFNAEISPLREELTQGARPMLLMLLATAGLVLLLACTNLANLTLARVLAQQRELAVRAALGAGRRQLVRGSLIESLTLSLTGGAVGVFLATAGLDLLKGFAAPLSPRAATVDLDGTVLLVAFGLAVLTGVLFGGTPLFSGRLKLSAALRDGGQAGGSGPGQARLRASLVTLQVALSTVLLIGAGLLLRSFDRLQQVDPGFNPDRVLTAQVALNWSKYTNMQMGRDFFRKVLERLDGHPEIVTAAVGSVAPLTQQGRGTTAVQIEHRPLEEGQAPPALETHFITPRYFEVLEIPVLRGRAFDERDHRDAPAVAVINATAARRLFSGEDPIGRRISGDDGESWIEIVGIAGDVRHYQLDRRAAEELYVPLAQAGLSNRLVVRTRNDPWTVSKILRQAVHEVDPQQPIDRLTTLEDSRRASIAGPRTTAWLLSLFAAVALVITAAGIAGMVAWSVSRRFREIGIRMALGARSLDVLGLVIRQGLWMIALGLAVGLAGAYLFTRLLADLLFEVSPLDPVTLITVTVLLLGVGLLACLSPAQRAVRVDPNVAVRTE